MRRRGFITLLGGAAVAWPLAARAQQPAMPVVGFLEQTSPDAFGDRLRAFRQGLKDTGIVEGENVGLRGFRQGLKETGFVEGENVAIEYRWAEDRYDRMPALAADLVRRQVAVIATIAPSGAFPAKAATTTIPIVFLANQDPVRLGLVASLARPGGNLTGINFFGAELSAKRLELLRALVPGAVRVAVLVSADLSAENTLKDVETAAHAMGLQIQIQAMNANTGGDIDAAFATIGRERPDLLFVGSGPFFTSRRLQLAHWATYHRVPATYSGRHYAEAGGLMSYGASLIDAWRQVGVYTGRILKGAKAADLPVVQSSKFELVINHQTARMLGLTVPPTLLASADEVIE